MLTRTAPLGGVAAIAFAAGVVTATAPGRAERQLVTQYVSDWAHRDYSGMYALLDAGSRRQISQARFAADLSDAASTATLTSITPGHVGSRVGDMIPTRMRVGTRLFGTLSETLEVPLSTGGSAAAIRFSDTLLFPGLRPGERLTRHARLPPRAELLASDGTPLARGTHRTSPIPNVAGEVVGALGPIPPAEATSYAAKGYPARARVGLTGLERIFQERLAGRPGGTLLAGDRVLARTTPSRGLAVRTTIEPGIERAAIRARAGRVAGIAVMDPRSGGVLALAGQAFSDLQPPGSTMKIITATGALQAGIVKLTDNFPVMTSVALDGFNLQNANGEACGGTFLNAFAVSCNSVFAPLGARLGAQRLVSTAERFGFNQQPSIPGAAESVIPPAAKIGDDLAVGSSAIGQGMVQTTALEMTDVAATIGMAGRRPLPTLLAGQPPRFVQVTSAGVAGLVQKMMIAVVQFGTGTAAQIPGVQVAGKTGTAELRNTAVPSSDPNAPPPSSPQNTDSWFVAYAPAGLPRIAVGALFPAQGAGAATAAPAAHDVLAAALHAH